MATRFANVSELDENSAAAMPEAAAIPVKRSCGVFLLSLVEAVCVFYVAAAKSGFLLLSASIASGAWGSFIHRDWIRIPTLSVAVIGSGFNLFLLWRSHKLRNSPAAAWRKMPLTVQGRLRIGLVLSLSVLTLVFAGIEIYLHRSLHHTIL